MKRQRWLVRVESRSFYIFAFEGMHYREALEFVRGKWPHAVVVP